MYLPVKFLKSSVVATIGMSLIFGLGGCSKQSTDVQAKKDSGSDVMVVQPVEVIRPAPEPAVAAANTAVALAANQYVYARLLTEELLTGTGGDLARLYDDTLLAWDNAEVALAAAQDAIATVGGSKLSDKAGGGQAEGDSAWAEPFARELSPAQANDYLLDFSDQMVADAATLGDTVWAAKDAVTSRSASEKEQVSRDIARSAKVDVLATTEKAAAPGGSIGALPGSRAAATDPEAFVVDGVDGLVMVSESGQNTIMVAHDQQVTVTGEVLDGRDGPVEAVFGLLPVDTAAAQKKEVVNAVPLVGTTPKQWSPRGKVTGVRVAPAKKGQTSVKATPVPKGRDPKQTEQNLEAAGVPVREAPDATPAQVADGLQVDPEAVRATIEILIIVVNDNVGDPATNAGPERQTRPRNPTPTEDIRQPADVPQGLPAAPPEVGGNVEGTYAAFSQFPDGDSGESTVEVTLDGSTLTIWSSDGSTITGFYDAASGSFSAESDGGEVNMVFDTWSDPITASGEVYSPAVGLGVYISLTKLG